jgi:hypothetical protein
VGRDNVVVGNIEHQYADLDRELYDDDVFQ